MEPLSSPGGVATLGDVGDVDLTGLEDGDGIVFDDSSATWLAGLPDGEFYQLGGAAASGDAGDFSSSGVTNNPEGLSGSNRTDIWWDQSGLRAYTYRASAPIVRGYDVFPAWSVDPGPPSDWLAFTTLTNQAQLTTNGGTFQLHPDGTGFLHSTSSGGNAFTRVFDLAIPFDVSSAALTASSAITNLGTSGGAARFTADGLTVFIQVLGVTQFIKKYALTIPFSLSPNALIFSFPYSDDSASINGWVLSLDGLFLYASRNSDKRLVSWEFTVPFDMSSSNTFDGTNGPLLNAGSNFFVPSGFQIRNDTGAIFMGDSLQSGSAAQRLQILDL